jgi:hypothetical protein
MDTIIDDVGKAVAAIGRIDAVLPLLAVLRDTTEMRVAAIARVTDHGATICAVLDGLQTGIEAGSPFALGTILAVESQLLLAPVIVEHASANPRHRADAERATYPVESFVSVPIFLPTGGVFGIFARSIRDR